MLYDKKQTLFSGKLCVTHRYEQVQYVEYLAIAHVFDSFGRILLF